MKFKNKLLTCIVMSTLLSASAKAESSGGLFLEPALTYQTGEMKVTYPSPFSDSTEKTTGFGLGLRLGVHVHDIIFLAADGRFGRPTYESSALGGSGSAELSNLGLTLGAQTPFAGIRVWGTYLISGSLDPAEINNVDVKFNNPKGYRLGAGIYIAAFSINLEYQDSKYDSVTVEKAGPISGTFDNIKGTDKSTILSVSFPVAL